MGGQWPDITDDVKPLRAFNALARSTWVDHGHIPWSALRELTWINLGVTQQTPSQLRYYYHWKLNDTGYDAYAQRVGVEVTRTYWEPDA